MPNYQPRILSELQSEKEKKLLAERERIDTKLTYHKHQLKALEHEEAQLERKTRNHRIFTRGGMLESLVSGIRVEAGAGMSQDFFLRRLIAL